MKKRRDKKWSNFISRVSKKQISSKEIKDSKEITSVSIKEERSNDRIDIPQLLTIANTKEKEEMQRDSKIEKRSYAERVKENTKPKGNINVNNTKICLDQDGDIRVENFKIDETNITNNRNTRKKAKQKIMDKKVENQVLEGTSHVDLSLIYSELLNDESNVSYQNISPPSLILDSSSSLNHFNAQVLEDHTKIFGTQDKEFLSVLESIENMNDSLDSSNKVSVTSEGRLSGYFFSETVFNLSRKVLIETEIKILEKGLDFAPIQRKINEPELRSDFEEFCRRVRVKWHFRNEPSPDFSNIPYVKSKSKWNPPKGHPAIEIFLSKVENDLFKVVDKELGYSNFTSEEWKALRSLADDKQIVIKKADKGSCVVIWDRDDYLAEAERQLKDENVYRNVNFNEKLIEDLTEYSNKIFKDLRRGGYLTGKQLDYYSYKYKKTCNLGKLYLLPKIHKRLYNVPG